MAGPTQLAPRSALPSSRQAAPTPPTPPTPHVAWIQVHHTGAPDARADGADDEAWLAACYRVTPRLERVSATCALLDLGSCTDDEAAGAAEHLLQRLAALGGGRRQVRARIGIGATMLCAQLALLESSLSAQQPVPPAQIARAASAACDRAPIKVLPVAEAPAVIRALPVRRLPALHPADTVPGEAVARLKRYGLRTLGQVACLGEATLRRQFGERVGAALAALAAGRDLRPLVPTPQPATLRCRMAFPSGATAERVLASLVPLAEQIARRLAAEDRQARRLRLALTWQTGGVSAGQVRPRMLTAEGRHLAQQLSDLCRTLLLAAPVASIETDPSDDPGIPIPSGASLIEGVLVELGDLVPLTPAQATFWRTAAQRQAAVIRVTETLAYRFGGRPQLVHAQCAVPHAILSAERYHWLPVPSADEPEKAMCRLLPPRDQAPVLASASDETRAGSAWEGVPHRLHWW